MLHWFCRLGLRLASDSKIQSLNTSGIESSRETQSDCLAVASAKKDRKEKQSHDDFNHFNRSDA